MHLAPFRNLITLSADHMSFISTRQLPFLDIRNLIWRRRVSRVQFFTLNEEIVMKHDVGSRLSQRCSVGSLVDSCAKRLLLSLNTLGVRQWGSHQPLTTLCYRENGSFLSLSLCIIFGPWAVQFPLWLIELDNRYTSKSSKDSRLFTSDQLDSSLY